MQLILSIIFLILTIVSWASIIAFFIFGFPIGFIFLAFSVWSFAIWRYKKSIPINVVAWLSLLPILGLLPLLTANRDLFGLNRFATIPPNQMPAWVPVVSLINELVLPALWFVAIFSVVIYFLRQAQKSL